MRRQYSATNTETSKLTVTVMADNQEEAEQMVSDAWRSGRYILDADNFVDVDFTAVPKINGQN